MEQPILMLLLQALIILKYKAKLLETAVAQASPNNANGILQYKTVALPLNYLSNLW